MTSQTNKQALESTIEKQLSSTCLKAVFERFGTGTLGLIRLSQKAHLKSPDLKLHEGFKVDLWQPSGAD